MICVCYQHARFIVSALDSVVQQTHQHVELIIVDDGSTDGSDVVLTSWVQNHPKAKLILNQRNLGYCKAFNLGWRICTGDYVIDLAGDDLLLPTRIEKGLAAFAGGNSTGIQFTDAIYIAENGEVLSKHSDRFPHAQIPRGFVFTEVLKRYFICSPTMMISRQVLEKLGGYDETLSYEDFDLWVRAARHFPFHYLPEALVKKRNVSRSLSEQQFRGAEVHNLTTFRVCEKAVVLAATRTEKSAIRYRIVYEAWQSVKRGELAWLKRYCLLWVRTWR